ncbi:heterokaryon incompatibility protein-domain-containing protein, partial [Bisporella sp. PMI_857]
LPKRLVEIRNDQMDVRLVETDALDSVVCYAALSHVWGDPATSAPFLVTTEETLRDRLQTIEFQDLPLTFRDAIRLSAALGITYIWIDSLCIIQDSKSDWASEAPRMCTIYTNATLTIAATCATTAHHGFLERTASDFPPTRIYCRISMSQNTIPGYLYLIPMNTHWGYDDVTMELEGSVWNGRGWTFQERVLSRRILHFIKDKWIFECQNGNASEDNRPPGSFFNRMPWLGGEMGSGKASLSANDLLDNYREAVQAYTGRALTRVSDRLAAFSGVIQRISDLTGEANIAGLWRSRLPQDLLWYTYPQIPSSRKPKTPRAPSWSWVAWDGQIGYHYNRDMMHTVIEVLDLGELSSAYIPGEGALKIRGHLVPLTRIELDEHRI